MLTGTKATQFVEGQIISMTWKSTNKEDCCGERGSGQVAHVLPEQTTDSKKTRESIGQCHECWLLWGRAVNGLKGKSSMTLGEGRCQRGGAKVELLGKQGKRMWGRIVWSRIGGFHCNSLSFSSVRVKSSNGFYSQNFKAFPLEFPKQAISQWHQASWVVTLTCQSSYLLHFL